jgi:hypothetical protein
MINQQDLQASLQSAQAENTAREMLNRGAPIENVVQATGLDRSTVENIFMKDQTMGVPSNPMPNPVTPAKELNSGIMNNPITDAGSQRFIEGVMQGGEESQDILEFLGVDLGIDLGNMEGNEEDDTTQSVGQALNSGSVAGSLGDTESFMSFLNNASLLESLTDKDKLEVYKKAAADIIGEPDYDSLLTQPDKVMPYLAAGLSLIKSGEAGDDWGAALGKAFISGYGAKRGEEKQFEKGKQALELNRQNRINQLVTTFGLEDFRNKAQLNRKLLESKLKAPMSIDVVGPSGTFADKTTMMMDEANFAALARQYPNQIRESKNSKKSPYTLVDVNGTSVNTFLDEDMLNKLTSIPSMANRILEGHEKMTNGKLYSILEDGERVERFLNPTQYNNLPEGSDPKFIPQTGTPKYVINKENGQPMWVMPSELARNPLLYKEIDNGFSMTINENGEVEFTQGDRYNVRYSKQQFEDINDKILGVDRGVTNYFAAADQLDKAIGDFITEFPEQQDLIFDNLGGNFARFADNIAISLGAINSMLTAPEKEGGFKFKVGDEFVKHEVFRENIIGSTEFAEFKKSPFARMLEASGITGARLDAALFDLAMMGAGSMNIDKGLDLRAISDFETKQFLKLQGGNAASMKQFQAVANDFRIKLLKRNIAELDLQMLPTNLYHIQLENGEPDLKAQKVLIDTTEKIKAKLVERLEGLENMDTSAKLNTNTKLFVADSSLDPGDDNVVTFPTINISPTSQFGQTLGITEPITTETKIQLNDGEFSYRDLMNNYSKYADEPQLQQNYYQLLQKELTPAQFQILNLHLIQAGLVETQ